MCVLSLVRIQPGRERSRKRGGEQIRREKNYLELASQAIDANMRMARAVEKMAERRWARARSMSLTRSLSNFKLCSSLDYSSKQNTVCLGHQMSGELTSKAHDWCHTPMSSSLRTLCGIPRTIKAFPSQWLAAYHIAWKRTVDRRQSIEFLFRAASHMHPKCLVQLKTPFRFSGSLGRFCHLLLPYGAQLDSCWNSTWLQVKTCFNLSSILVHNSMTLSKRWL